MKIRYLCSYHACLMQYSEDDALRYWTETQRRGVAAFNQCRWEAARNYLGMAHEIALLRSVVPGNRDFRPVHVLRPLELLVEMSLAENACEAASLLINATRNALDNANADWRRAIREPLDQHQRRLHTVLSANANRQVPLGDIGATLN